MRDIDVRKVLCDQLVTMHKDDPQTLIVEELGIRQGAARVDVAVVNGSLHGYEIKSAKDTLERLPRQLELYGSVFDTITLVTAENHLDSALNVIPDWWGVVLAREDSNMLKLSLVKETKTNDGVDPIALAELLWKEEALLLLQERDAAKGYRSKPRREIWKAVCEIYSTDELRDAVRLFLKRRSTLLERKLI